MKSTTALRKISALKKRIWVIQGGQGAGKTISIEIILANHAAAVPNREIYIASAELTKLRRTALKDFVKILNEMGIAHRVKCTNNTFFRFPNGSFVEFIGLDKADIGKGLRCDVFYFNELDKIPWETYRQASSRAKRVIVDYNPDSDFYAHSEIAPRKDADFLKLTFEDNEYLDNTEREEILHYYERGYDVPYDPTLKDDPPIVNKYYANLWKVYGRGEIGALEGVIHEDWEEVEAIPSAARFIAYGLDWGWTNPSAIVAIWEFEGHRYWDEIAYGPNLNNEMLGQAIIDDGKKGICYADQAEPKSITDVSKMGVRITGADKGAGSVQRGIKDINKKKFYVTARSKNIQYELRNYIWLINKSGKAMNVPRKENDHACNASMYVYNEEGKYSGSYSVGRK